jgi:hypothetical protein
MLGFGVGTGLVDALEATTALAFVTMAALARVTLITHDGFMRSSRAARSPTLGA